MICITWIFKFPTPINETSPTTHNIASSFTTHQFTPQTIQLLQIRYSGVGRYDEKFLVRIS